MSIEHNDMRFQFALEEYKSLRSEIDIRVKEAFQLIIYCLTAVAAAYGLFFSAQTSGRVACGEHQTLINWAAYSGSIFPIFGWIKSAESWNNVLKIADYIRGIERKIGVTGWEHKVHQTRQHNYSDSYNIDRPPYHAFWFLLCSATLIVDVLVWNSRL